MAAISSATYSSGQYLAKALTGAVNLRASHTIAVRVKHTSTATNTDTIVGTYYGTSYTWNASGSSFGRNNGVASTALNVYRINDSFSPTADSAERSTCYGNTSTWYHCCLVYNASTQQIRFYIDGTYIGQTASNTTRTTSSTSNTMATAWSPGKFADFAFYSAALSDSDVASLAAYRVPQVTSNLVCFARLDSDGTDSSGNGNNLSTAGSGTAITWSTSDNPPQPETPTVDLGGSATSGSTLSGALTKIYSVAGAPTTASTLAGTLSVAKVLAGSASTASTLSGDLTLTKQLTASASTASSLAAWLRPRWGRRIVDGVGTSMYRSALGVTAPSFTCMAWVRANGFSSNTDVVGASFFGDGTVKLRSSYFNGDIYYDILVFDGTNTVIYSDVLDTDWHHLAVTYDGSLIRVYVDGVNTASTSTTMAGPAINIVDIGTDNQNTGSFGEVAQVKLWSSKLETSDVQSEMLYNTPHHDWPGYLEGWWPLTWQNPGQDESGASRDMTDFGTAEAQSEAPSGDPAPLNACAGTATTASTLAGTLSLDQPLVGSATSATTLSGTLSQEQPLVGAASSASTLAGTLSQEQPLVAAATSSSSLAGTLSQDQPLTAAASTASTLAGSLDVSVPLAAAASSASTLAGTLGVDKPIAGGATTASTLTGALGIEGAFAGNALTASTLTGTLSQEQPLVGEATSASSLAGQLSQHHALAAGAASSSTLQGDLTLTKQVAGDAVTASTLDGTLGVAKALAAGASTSTALSGTLSLTQQLEAAATSGSTLTGTLSIENVLAGAAASSSQLSGTLSVLGVVWQLSSTPRTASTLTGALTVTVPASARGRVVTRGAAREEPGPAYIPPLPSPGRHWPPRPR